MDPQKQEEEKLREAACFGDEDGIRSLVCCGVNVNAQHSVNGWTALHWAAKRGHSSIVRYLLAHGADPSLPSLRGETPAVLTDSEEIRELLLSGGGESLPDNHSCPPLPITPNYLSNPPLAYKVCINDKSHKEVKVNPTKYSCVEYPGQELELVVKVRTSDPPDQDFIEVEVPISQLSFSALLKTCCEELDVNVQKVAKIRKLPNTILRKDKDVLRLHNFQELEVVVQADKQDTSSNSSESSQNSSEPQPFMNVLAKSSVYMNGNHVNPTSPLLEKSNYCKNGMILY